MFQMVNKHIEARILYFPHQIPELGEGEGVRHKNTGIMQHIIPALSSNLFPNLHYFPKQQFTHSILCSFNS